MVGEDFVVDLFEGGDVFGDGEGAFGFFGEACDERAVFGEAAELGGEVLGVAVLKEEAVGFWLG